MSKTELIKKRTPQRWVIPVAVVLLTAVAIGSFFYIYSNRKGTETTRPSRVGQVKDKTPGTTGGKGSPEYNNTLYKYENEQSQIAERTGESRLSTVIGKKEASTLIDDAVKPEAPEVVIAPKPKPVEKRAATRRKTNNNNAAKEEAAYQKRLQKLTQNLSAAVEEEMVMINKTMQKEKPIQVSKVFSVNLDELKNGISLVSTAQAGSIPNSPMTQIKTTPFDLGEVLYAVNEIAVNSDIPGPVVAQVVSGPLKGGKFIGAFERHEDMILLKFSRFALPGGEGIPIEAYAVDPMTTSVSVGTDVDYHYLSRWGGLIAASFLEGFGEAVRYSGMGTYTTGFGTVVTDTPDYSFEEQAWIAAGKVGERLSVPMYQNWYTPPTVTLETGTGLGILIVTN